MSVDQSTFFDDLVSTLKPYLDTLKKIDRDTIRQFMSQYQSELYAVYTIFGLGAVLKVIKMLREDQANEAYLRTFNPPKPKSTLSKPPMKPILPKQGPRKRHPGRPQPKISPQHFYEHYPSPITEEEIASLPKSRQRRKR